MFDELNNKMLQSKEKTKQNSVRGKCNVCYCFMYQLSKNEPYKKILLKKGLFTDNPNYLRAQKFINIQERDMNKLQVSSLDGV